MVNSATVGAHHRFTFVSESLTLSFHSVQLHGVAQPLNLSFPHVVASRDSNRRSSLPPGRHRQPRPRHLCLDVINIELREN
jgi:hypothetical protein